MPSDKYGDNREGYAKLKQQASTRRARERELERKRARGEISCAECRRLKLKCNKKVPCNSCIRRGCHSICPNGLLTTGQGSRFVLANTDKLHTKLIQMSQRIRQLEDALQIAHSSVSVCSHPLLSELMLSIKSGVDGLTSEEHGKEEIEEVDEEEEVTITLGTLTVEDCGASRFVGRVGAETLLMGEPGYDGNDSYADIGPDWDLERKLPEGLLQAANSFPFSHTLLRDELLTVLKNNLPTYERATALVEAYLGNLCWLPCPILRDQIMEELLPILYKGGCLNQLLQEDGSAKHERRHKLYNQLALALAVFACGAAGDLTLSPNNPEGKMYHTLALATLNKHCVMSSGGNSLETVQTIVLIAQYDFSSADKSTLEATWKTLSFGLIVAASIGLHRDPAHWGLEPKHIQRRRFVFWEIFCFDKFKSLGTGRPSIFHLQETDCEFPEDQDSFVDQDGTQKEGPTRWRHRFIKEVVAPISEHLCLTRPIKYSEILDFDRKIREFDEPPMPPGFAEFSGAIGELRPRMWSLQKELSLLAIHRNFFARAMIKDPENPLRSPFAPSFLAAYACSIKLLRNVRACFEHAPGIIFRFWPVWTHCLTSAVVIGSVASNVNQPSLANAAFHDLELAVRFFQDGSFHPVAKRGLPILRRLRDRAISALQNKMGEVGVSPGVKIPKEEIDETEELTILHGSARLVHRIHRETARGCSHVSSTKASSGSASTPGSAATSNEGSPQSIPSTEPPLSSQPKYQVTGDGISPTLPRISPPANSETSMARPGPSQYPIQPTSNSIDQDIKSLLDMIYSPPKDTSNAGATPFSFETTQKVSGLQPQSQPVNQQFPMLPYNPLDTNSSFLTPSNPWVPEAAQLESIFSGTYGGDGALQGPFEALPNVTTVAPSYDMTWMSSNTSNRSAGFTGEAAQFVEDWRLQAAIEGTYFLTEPEPDVKMKF